MRSSFLEAERERLLHLIHQLSTSGDVAPAYCWLTESSSTKGGKTYTYVVLITQKPDRKPRSQSLGKPGSLRHQHWQRAIARREAITELQQQVSLLTELLDRQMRTWNDLQLTTLIHPVNSSVISQPNANDQK